MISSISLAMKLIQGLLDRVFRKLMNGERFFDLIHWPHYDEGYLYFRLASYGFVVWHIAYEYKMRPSDCKVFITC